MPLTQKEKGLLKDLQCQEQLCIEKYNFYANQAKDPELKNLFQTIKNDEQHHYDTLSKTMQGNVPTLKTPKKPEAASYQPKATYGKNCHSQEKRQDKFLATDSIATEKYVSSAYDNDLFRFASTEVRQVLNEIQTQEQNHAEMIYKYQAANGMA